MRSNIKAKVIEAVMALIEDALHPEKYDKQGRRINSARRVAPWSKQRQDVLKPRQRLGVRLAILNALTEVETSLMKAIAEDTEAAKDHQEEEVRRNDEAARLQRASEADMDRCKQFLGEGARLEGERYQPPYEPDPTPEEIDSGAWLINTNKGNK